MKTKDSGEIFIFGIALRPRRRARNWERILDNLQETLRSILNQLDRNFEVFIATEDEIDLPEIANPKIKLLNVRPPATLLGTETNYASSHQDIYFRRKAITEAAKSSGGRYLMHVDADDLISNRLVSKVRRMPDAAGYAIVTGWVMDFRTRNVHPCPHKNLYDYNDGFYDNGFDTICGSTLIFSLKDNGFEPKPWPLAAIVLGHHIVRKTLAQSHNPILAIDDPLVIYVLNTGENNSNVHPDAPWKKFSFDTGAAAARFGRQMTAELRAEFGQPFSAEPKSGQE